MQCGASPLRGLAASAVSFLIPSRLHIGLAVFICSLHGVDRTCICCSLWVLFIVLRLFSETVCWHPLQFGVLPKTISSGFIITSELNVDHFNTEYLVHLGIFQQTVKNEWESRTFKHDKHGSRGSRKHHTVPRLLHTAFQPDAVRHSRYCLPPQRLLLAGRTPAKSSPKLKGVRTTAAITFVTVRNALWVDVSHFVFFRFSAVLSFSMLFAAFWSSSCHVCGICSIVG